MPIHVLPLSRRSFLARSVAAAAITLGPVRFVAGAEAGYDPDFFALLSDTHVPGDPATTARGVNMTDNLAQTVAALVGLERRPAAVLINGDCAYLKGLPADYANLARLVRPLSEAGLPLHLTMGNHDARGPLYEALAAQRPENPPVATAETTPIAAPRKRRSPVSSRFTTTPGSRCSTASSGPGSRMQRRPSGITWARSCPTCPRAPVAR